MLGSLFLVFVLGAGVAGMGVAFLSWLRRARPGAAPLTVFVVLASAWALTQGLQLASGDAVTTELWARAGLVLSAVIPLTWFVTVLAYTGRDRWLTRTRLGVLFLEPLFFAVLVWTNGAGGHELVWSNGRSLAIDGLSVFASDWGLAFWGHQAVSYLFVVAGGVLLLRLIVGTTSLYRSQSTALLVAIALPMMANALAIFRVVPRPYDPTAVGYVVTGGVLAWAMFRTRLFSLSPLTRELGREEALAELDDRVLVLDGADRVVDANDAAESLLGAPLGELLGDPLAAHLPNLEPVLEDTPDSEDVALEHEGKLRYFDVRVSPLSRARGAVAGRLVSLRDVTDRRQREQRLDVLNRLLRHNLRNDLNVVRGNAELARSAVEDETVRERLSRIIEKTDAIGRRTDKVGRLTRTLEGTTLATAELADVVGDALESLSATQDASAVAVDVPDDLTISGASSLPVALEELVANALEHGGEAPSVTVRLDRQATDADWAVLLVTDDGPGIAPHEYRSIVEGRETPLEHASGVGLWLVNWIVTEIGGTLAFETPEEGTTVRLLLPRADDVDEAGAGERAAGVGQSDAADPVATDSPGVSDPDPNPDPSLPTDEWVRGRSSVD